MTDPVGFSYPCNALADFIRRRFYWPLWTIPGVVPFFFRMVAGVGAIVDFFTMDPNRPGLRTVSSDLLFGFGPAPFLSASY